MAEENVGLQPCLVACTCQSISIGILKKGTWRDRSGGYLVRSIRSSRTYMDGLRVNSVSSIVEMMMNAVREKKGRGQFPQGAAARPLRPPAWSGWERNNGLGQYLVVMETKLSRGIG